MRYRQGAVTITDWLNAQEQRRQAELAVDENRFAQYQNRRKSIWNSAVHRPSNQTARHPAVDLSGKHINFSCFISRTLYTSNMANQTKNRQIAQLLDHSRTKSVQIL